MSDVVDPTSQVTNPPYIHATPTAECNLADTSPELAVPEAAAASALLVVEYPALPQVDDLTSPKDTRQLGDCSLEKGRATSTESADIQDSGQVATR
jgi:hypothetical protein